MTCIVCRSDQIIDRKCKKCGFDYLKEGCSFVFQLNKKELTDFNKILVQPACSTNHHPLGITSYSQYLVEVANLCKAGTISESDIQSFVRQNRLDARYKITVDDVAADVKNYLYGIIKNMPIAELTKLIEEYRKEESEG